MKRRLTLLCALLCATMVHAAVQPGEIILYNGVFQGDANNPVSGEPSTAPNLWTPSSAVECVRFAVESGGASGNGYVRYFQPDPTQLGKEVTVRQAGLVLVEGEKYRITATVRTKDFESPHCGIVIYDNGWYHDIGIKKFPKNQDWTVMTAEFPMISANGGMHTFAMFACDFKGTLEIKDVKLEALSERGQKGTSKSELLKMLLKPGLVPMEPLLNRIVIPEKGQGKEHPEMSLLFYGTLPEETTRQDYDIRYAVNDLPEDAVALREGTNVIAFKRGVTPGDFTLKLRVVNRKSGEVICQQEFAATFVKPVKTSTEGHKRLNNLVVELLNQPIQKNAEAQTFRFCTVRDGWVCIAAQNAAAEALEVTLDDSLAVIKAATPRLETFRDIAMGEHTLTIRGAVNGGNLVVRSIPEIFNSYGPCRNSPVPENPPYDWDFQNKYVHHGITTHNSGPIPKQHLKEFLDAGYKWTGWEGTSYISADKLLEKLNTSNGMKSPDYQGVCCDEQFFGNLSSIVPYTEGIRRFKGNADHIVYTWINGSPAIYGIDNDFLSACANTCRGHGKLLSEVYCRTAPTLEEAKNYLNNAILGRVINFKKCFPHILDHWGVAFGNFVQIPALSLAHHPHVDFKYYLDMQFNLIANHPECKDMAITGYWGTMCCDFELYRWCFMLTRHYCIEGKTTMLSDKYGFTYAPGHVLNGDFVNGLKGWKATSDITTGYHYGYGRINQARWGTTREGDTFAILNKKEGETSSVTQVAKGLLPGRAYCLQFVVIDYNDLKERKYNPKRVGIDVTLDDGAAVDKAQSWVHVDKRKTGYYERNKQVPKCNLHHVVFRAVKQEVTITIHNANAPAGEVAAVNYVMLNPFLEP